MPQLLPFSNWSLKKALDTEPDTFIKARIRIIFAILLLSVCKAVITLITSIPNGQQAQTFRALVGLLLYSVLVKYILSRPGKIKTIAHIMLCAGLLLIWSNVVFYIHGLNLATLQFIFMIVLSGFYTIGGIAGLIYSTLSVLPIVISMMVGFNIHEYSTQTSRELASPGYEIIIVLNFITIIVAHYLFFRAFQSNIGEKEKLNDQLRWSVAEANELAASKSNFLSTMSHELRTPLNAVIGTTELLIKDKPEERQQENLKILQSSAVDLLSLINNVLDFNKIDSEKLELEKLPVNLAELVENVCAGLKVRAAGKGLKLNMQIDGQLKGVYLLTDPTRLSQVLYNLVGNAIKFTDKGSVTVTLSCTQLDMSAAEVRFSVEDTGIGISAEKHESIFDVFSQAESHITRKYGGTGLGLPIVKQLLLLFDSRIELESTPGKGSKFYFTLPLQIASVPAISERDRVGTSIDTPDLGHLRVLIAEDNEINRMIIKKQLAIFNIQPVVVENGELAYERWLKEDFDAVILDLHMPVADGYETVRRIRAYNKVAKANIHVIAFTASVNERDQLLEAGFNDFLYKPANIKDLKEKLETISKKAVH
jgi:signal transduction histidine kinase/ActR/RegA family two-component response regulator